MLKKYGLMQKNIYVEKNHDSEMVTEHVYVTLDKIYDKRKDLDQ